MEQNRPSEEALEAMIRFMLRTAIPRRLAEKAKQKENKSA